MRRLMVAALAVAGATGCEPEIHDTSFQDLLVELRGPEVAEGSSADPFARTKTYEVTLRFFEDAAGLVPYGADLTAEQRGETFKDFSPVKVVRQPAGSKSWSLSEAGPVALPGLFDAGGHPRALSSLFVSAEVVGLDDAQKTVARARCPVMALAAVATSGDEKQVTCRAFFGLVGQWNPVPGPQIARRDFAAAVLPDGRVVVAGGRDQTTAVASVELFDPNAADGAGWRTVGNLSEARAGLTGTATRTGHVVFAGGLRADGSESSALDVFDPAGDGSLSTHGPGLAFGARGAHAAALLNDATVVLAGGYRASSAVSGSELIASDGVPLRGPISRPRRDPCLVQVASNLALLCGGGERTCETFDGTVFRETGDTFVIHGEAFGAVDCVAVGGTAYLLAGASGSSRMDVYTWRKGDKAPGLWEDAPYHSVHHGVAVANGKVVVAGGSLANDGQAQSLSRGYWFDPASDGSFSVLTGESGEMNATRARHQLVGLPDGTVMAIGGTFESGAPQAEIFVVP